MPRSRGDESGTNDDGKRGCRALPLAAFLLSDDVHDEGEFAGGRLIPTTTSLLVPSGSRAAIAVDLGGSEQRMAAWQSGSCSPSAARPYNPRVTIYGLGLLADFYLLRKFGSVISRSVKPCRYAEILIKKNEASPGKLEVYFFFTSLLMCWAEIYSLY
uniref:Uncharacterized protein n=1 Tax=Oryza sativa subsp. japonica TaxID=39947 RepID=Q53LW1_ORYSJ|nr:hypothetical protein LOC_Os11g20170 [Oryza sativa Japonica Group]